MMQSLDEFKAQVASFKVRDITNQEINILKKYVEDESFILEKMLLKLAVA